MIERDCFADLRHVLTNEREISALKRGRGRKIRPSNDDIVESNDPRCLIHIRPRFQPKHAIDRRIGARRSNGCGGARFEVASLPFFDLRLENANIDAAVFKLARPAQLLATGGKGLSSGQLSRGVGWLAPAGAGDCQHC